MDRFNPWLKKLEAAVTLVHPGFNTGAQVQTVAIPPPVFVDPNAVNPLAPSAPAFLHPQAAYPQPVFSPTFYTPVPQAYSPPGTHPAVAPHTALPHSHTGLPPARPSPLQQHLIQSQPPFPVHQPANTNKPLFSETDACLTTSSFFGFGNFIQGDSPPATQENAESKIAKILRVFPEASPHDARKALDQTNGDMDAALSLLIDWRTEENAKTQEAMQVCASTAFAVFPLSTNNVAHSSYPEWLKSGAVFTTTAAHSMAVALASTFPASGRQKALLVGINYEGTRDELNGPRQDLKRMGRMLEKVYGFRVSGDTRVELTDAPENYKNPIYLPTKRNILAAMKWLIKDAQTGDVLFFHYSGHGSQKPSPDGRAYESDGLDESICPLDFRKAGEITDDQIAECLIVNLPVGVRLFCVMDCCHSGTGLDLPFVCDIERGSWVKIRTKYSTQADVTLVSGCRADQTSADLTLRNGKRAGGALTLAFLSSLSAKPFKHTYHSLVSRTSKVLKDRGFSQVIQLSSSIPFDYKKRPFRFDNILGPL
eukprot:Gregarina_sp_Pseudo_9__144@NODE_109_length_4207_cov_15_727207_g101_i0_p2_GENE_NODE_109_length_4207_cov_15_727207_g101_i0NODE_109_length_4207_cov_15_727207_g101_i0_p2_ORF_typecomplete_len538_score84_16Peptidase_C14/PF00656_22/7_5e56Raptor_N/PF14538_6/0_00038CUE/PF02845_16/0_034Peptidase_C13/PF01650_18/0_073UBA/PF00627_31/0_18HOIPUBA/PF16678_5/0_17DUF982/PF06169_12/4_6e03DUF982/PF06169_12/0_79_NODE_109_length_4207_cov_15_727207_g101_i025274140